MANFDILYWVISDAGKCKKYQIHRDKFLACADAVHPGVGDHLPGGHGDPVQVILCPISTQCQYRREREREKERERECLHPCKVVYVLELKL